MDFKTYQEQANQTSSHKGHVAVRREIRKALAPKDLPNDVDQVSDGMRGASGITMVGERVIMAAMGLTGEAGEADDYLKKVLFHGHQLDRDKIGKELGDVLWYVAEAATALGLSLDLIAQGNIAKLEARYGGQFSTEKSINRK